MFSTEECFKNCNLPFHSNAKSKASACRNIAQLMFWVDCLLFLCVSSCSNSPFLSSMNGNTHKPQLSVRVSYFTKRPQSTNLPSVSGVPQDGSIFPSDPLQGDQTQSVGVWSARECINKSLREKIYIVYTSPDFFLQYKGIHRKREKRQLRWFSGMLCAQWIRITVPRFRAEHERSVWLTAQGESPPPISERQGSGPGTKEEIRPIVIKEGRRLQERYDNIRWFIARSVHCSTGGKVFAWTCTLVLYVLYWERWFAWGT